MISTPFIQKNLNDLQGNNRTYVYLSSQTVANTATYTFGQDIYLIFIACQWENANPPTDGTLVQIQDSGASAILTLPQQMTEFFFSANFGSIGIPDVRKIYNGTGKQFDVSAFGYYYA